MQRKKVYMVGDMAHTPWKDDQPFRDIVNIELVKTPETADFFVSRERRWYTDELLAMKKPNVIWTHEPYLELGNQFMEKDGENYFLIFSMYACNIYMDNFLYAPRDRIENITADSMGSDFANKKVANLSTHRVGERWIGGVNVSLDTERSKLAIDLHKAGMATIMGSDWPEGVAVGNTRKGAWGLSKNDFLKDFNFSLCFENTNARNYVSEKIWQAIEGHTLPIYHANATIYDTFPPDSFIDYAKLKDYRELIDIINQMSLETWLTRLNTCIDIHNQAVDLGKREKSQNLMFHNVRKYMPMIDFIGKVLASGQNIDFELSA